MIFLFTELNDIIVEALEVLINHVLYIRNIYPAQIFQKRQIYNSVVYVSIYKQLNSYIKNVLSAARELLSTNDLKCLVIEMYEEDNNLIYEQYKFEINNFSQRLIDENHQSKDNYLLDFEEEIRNCLYKSAERLNKLNTKLPNSARFRINLRTNELAYINLNHNSQKQSFIWLKNKQTMAHTNQKKTESIALLPLATVKFIGLSLNADILQQSHYLKQDME